MVDKKLEQEDTISKLLRTELSSNISYYRKNLKITRSELAKRVGVTEASIGQYERGSRIPSIETLWHLSDVFNIPIDALLGHSENYNVVRQYRLNKAEEFFTHAGWTGFIVNLLENEHVQIQQKVLDDFSKYEVIDGKIIREVENEIPKTVTLIEFNDLDSFISFAELLMNTFLRAKYGYEHLLKVITDLKSTGSFRVPALELLERKTK